MANTGPTPIKYSFVAASDLSTKQFYFVKLTASNTVDVCSAATDKPIGVLQNTPGQNGTAEVLISGIGKVSSSAALAAGAQIGTSAAGQGAALVAGTDTTKYVVGTVLEASGAAGGLATCV